MKLDRQYHYAQVRGPIDEEDAELIVKLLKENLTKTEGSLNEY